MAGSGRHEWFTFADDAELATRAVAFLREGLEAGERLLYVVDRPRETLLRHVAGLGNVERLQADGALAVLPWGDVYDADGPPDLRARLAQYTALLDDALAAGHTGLRAVADGTPVYREPRLVAANRRWELVADRWMATRPISVLCVADRRVVPAEVLEGVCCLHADDEGRRPFGLRGDALGARLDGEVDLFSAERLGELLGDVGPEARTLDVTGTAFLDHHALRALRDHARREGGLVVTGASPQARRLWELLELGADVRWD